jgi:hypothetical protein
MDRVLLRKLSRKSKFEAGRFPDLTVQDLLNSDRIYYLVALYYKYANISYLDDILKELCITGELVIEKPGANYPLFKLWKYRWCSTQDLDKRMKIASHQKAQERRDAVNAEHRIMRSRSFYRNSNRRSTT